MLKHKACFTSQLTGCTSRPGPCDGVGGVSKRHVDEAIERKQVTVIDCAEDYFKWTQEDISRKINYLFVSGKRSQCEKPDG